MIALAAAASCWAGCVEEYVGQPNIEAYSFLVGSWEGELEYLDYGDNRTLVQLPTSMSCEPSADGTSLELTFSYVEPSGRVERSTERLAPTSEGVYLGDLWRIKEPAQQVSSEDFRVVLERDGEDNGQPATIENSIILVGDELTITTVVTYRASGEVLRRNQYRLRRSTNEPEGA